MWVKPASLKRQRETEKDITERMRKVNHGSLKLWIRKISKCDCVAYKEITALKNAESAPDERSYWVLRWMTKGRWTTSQIKTNAESAEMYIITSRKLKVWSFDDNLQSCCTKKKDNAVYLKTRFQYKLLLMCTIIMYALRQFEVTGPCHLPHIHI